MLSRNDIGALLSEHGLAPRRDLGQNFVVDANIVRKIARLADVGPDRSRRRDRRRARLADVGVGRDRRDDHRDRGRPRCRRRAARRRRRSGERDGRRSRRAAPRLAHRLGRVAALGAGRQPAVQRGHTPGLRPPRSRAGGRANAGDGAARSRRATVCRRRAPRPTARSASRSPTGRRRASPARFRPASSCRDRRSSRHWPTSAADRRRPSTCRRDRCSSWSARRSVNDARCCVVRWPTVVAPEVFDAAGIDPQRRPEGARRDRVGSAHHGVVGGARDAQSWSSAPAKLTLSLRDHRRARRRLPPHRRRDGHPRMARHR